MLSLPSIAENRIFNNTTNYGGKVMLKKIAYLVVLVGLFLTFAHQAEGQQKKSQTKKTQNKTVQPKTLTAEQIAKKFLPAVVLIVCDNGKGSFSQGSGFFIREEVILTNYHVIKGMVRGKAKTALSKSQSEEWWISAILFVDAQKDLALISISGNPFNILWGERMKTFQVEPNPIFRVLPPADEDFKDSPEPKIVFTDKADTKKKKVTKSKLPKVRTVFTAPPVLSLSKSDKLTIGEKIYVLSNPKGLIGTISQGIISSEIRKVKDIELLQIDAPISPGSSGGAVLNARGEVIGIATGSLSSGQNLNFAIPSSEIKSFIKRAEDFSSDFSSISDLENAWGYPLKLKEFQKSKVAPSPETDAPKTDAPKKEEKPKASDSETKSQKELTFEERVQRLLQNLQNTSISKKTTKAQINKASFSKCSLNVSYSTTKLENNSTWEDSYTFNLKNIKALDVSKNQLEWDAVFIDIVQQIVETTTFNDGSIRASLKKTIVIPAENPEKALEIWLDLSILKDRCITDDSSIVTDQPTLLETSNWITDKIERTKVLTTEGVITYPLLRFSQCKMNLNKIFRGDLTSKYEIDLRFLQEVMVGRNTQRDWSIWLKFSRSFDVLKQLRIVKEYVKDDKIVIFFDDYENAKRAGSAFARMLELCGEETKEPF